MIGILSVLKYRLFSSQNRSKNKPVSENAMTFALGYGLLEAQRERRKDVYNFEPR